MSNTEQRVGRPWAFYNQATHTYDTPDGTHVAAELVDGVACLADVLRISRIREDQRAALTRATTS